jgi:hypothetical protein
MNDWPFWRVGIDAWEGGQTGSSLTRTPRDDSCFFSSLQVALPTDVRLFNSVNAENGSSHQPGEQVEIARTHQNHNLSNGELDFRGMDIFGPFDAWHEGC